MKVNKCGNSIPKCGNVSGLQFDAMLFYIKLTNKCKKESSYLNWNCTIDVQLNWKPGWSLTLKEVWNTWFKQLKLKLTTVTDYGHRKSHKIKHIYTKTVSLQQQPSLILLSGVSYMDQMTP